MSDVPILRFDSHAKPSGDEWHRFFEVLADDSPVYLAQNGRAIGRVDADAIRRRIDATAFFPPIEAGV